MKNIAKEIIAIDRIARKKIELLENEKKGLNDFFKAEKDLKIKEYTYKIKKEIEETKKMNSIESADKETKASLELEQRKKEIKEMYDAKKEEWINLIYQDCLK